VAAVAAVPLRLVVALEVAALGGLAAAVMEAGIMVFLGLQIPAAAAGVMRPIILAVQEMVAAE
jgi:hypothetical protein